MESFPAIIPQCHISILILHTAGIVGAWNLIMRQYVLYPVGTKDAIKDLKMGAETQFCELVRESSKI